MVRPLSDLPRVVGNMAKAAGETEKLAVPPITRAVQAVTAAQGARFAIKGRSGAKVRLSASAGIKTFGGKPVGLVQGRPAGFWRIVEEGSSPHLIVGRNGSRRRGGRGLSRRSAFRRFTANVDEFNESSPIRLGSIGWRQYAAHPGHGPIGRPWATAMRASDQIVRTQLTSVATKQFKQAWT
jgi:hypothetical protein